MLLPLNTTFDILVEDDQSDLSALALAEFLLHISHVYQAVREHTGTSPQPGASEEEYRALWDRVPSIAVDRAVGFRGEPGLWPISHFRKDYVVTIKRISKNSPLEITLCGVMLGLAVAVILSGGNIEVSAKGVKCRLPPLGKGIQELRKALNEKIKNG